MPAQVPRANRPGKISFPATRQTGTSIHRPSGGGRFGRGRLGKSPQAGDLDLASGLRRCACALSEHLGARNRPLGPPRLALHRRGVPSHRGLGAEEAPIWQGASNAASTRSRNSRRLPCSRRIRSSIWNTKPISSWWRYSHRLPSCVYASSHGHAPRPGEMARGFVLWMNPPDPKR